jgi:ParB-like chromosome segregation protein Spo0J
VQIEEIDINDIIEYERNTKKHPQEQIDQIIKSIVEFGNNDPIAIDENNVILEGHGRFQALKQLGKTKINVIRISHLTEEQKKAYNITHNKITMNTNFNMDALKSEMESFKGKIDFELTGFSNKELGKMFIDDEINAIFAQAKETLGKTRKKKSFFCPHCGEKVIL